MRADRLLSMTLLLQSRGNMTAQELAGQLEVSERTIYRDIDALSSAGIPIYTQPGTNGGVFLDENYRISLTGLSSPEVQALFVSSGAGQLKDLGLGKAATDLLLKLLAALPSTQRDEAEHMRQRFYIDPTGWFHSNEPSAFLPLLQQAVWDDRKIRARYQRSDGIHTHRIIHPYALVAKLNIWYLLGQQVDGDFRTFRVSRFREVNLLDEQFQRSPDFDLPAHWKTVTSQFETQINEEPEPYAALIRIHPDLVWYIASNLGDQFERLDMPDPDGWSRLQITFPSEDNALLNVLSLGMNIEVLEPEALRARVMATADSIAGRYQKERKM